MESIAAERKLGKTVNEFSLANVNSGQAFKRKQQFLLKIFTENKYSCPHLQNRHKTIKENF